MRRMLIYDFVVRPVFDSLLLIFNRPDPTTKVFEAIRAARPARLYVAADGPRPDRFGEAERCARAREIATAVDWPCQVRTLFRNANLGCKRAMSGALDLLIFPRGSQVAPCV